MASTFVQLMLIAVIVVLPPFTKAVWGQSKLDQKLQESVQAGCTAGPVDVIIRVKEGHRKNLRDALKAHGDLIAGEFTSIDGVGASVHCQDLGVLASMPEISSVSANSAVEAHAARRTRANRASKKQSYDEAQQAAAAKLQVPIFQTMLAWPELRAASYLGASVTPSDTTLARTLTSLRDRGLTGVAGGLGIAVIDSGIAPGPEFENRISAFFDFTGGDVQVAAPSDPFGHGSHVAGLIAGKNVGVAPGARLVGLKVLSTSGRGLTSNVVRAIEFAISNRAALNIHVLNISLGHPIYESAATDPLVQTVERAVREGLVVVVSAGNFGLNKKTGLPGYGGVTSPGNAPSAITAGAARGFETVTRGDDRVAGYSSKGPSWYDGFAKPDVVAAGDNLLSVAALGSKLRLLQELRGNTGEYMRLSGTSMAAGVTSGIAALIVNVNPHLTPNALKAVLQYSAVPVSTDAGMPADPLTQGGGQVNGGGAAMLAAIIDADAPVGTRWLTGAITPTTQIGGTTYTWSQAVIWGNHKVSGENLMAEQRPAWASNIVWGEGLGSEDDNIVWGNLFSDDDNIVWGNALDQDDNIVWGNNIVWGTSEDDNIVWGNLSGDDDNIVWGNNIVWGDKLIGLSLDDDNIVWGNVLDDDNIVWGNLDDDNIVWGNLDDDNRVWGSPLAES